MQKIDFLARETHHIEHARAVYDNLPPVIRGQLCSKITDCKHELVAVFSYKGLKDANAFGKKIIYFEHGAGLSYNEDHPSYAGSRVGRENVVLRLVPNEIAKKRDEGIYPHIEVVGMSIMDKWSHISNKPQKPYTVAFSPHWDAMSCPETRSAAYHFIKGLKNIRHTVVGHGHPRIINRLEIKYAKIGIRSVNNFGWIMRNADVLLVDNSSVMYMFPKPIVLLNDPRYRRDVEHEGNPRFWRHADMAPNANSPEDLNECIKEALSGKYDKRRKECIDEVIPYKGESVKRTIKVIKKWMSALQ